MSVNPLCEQAYHEANISGSSSWQYAREFVSIARFDLWIDWTCRIQPA